MHPKNIPLLIVAFIVFTVSSRAAINVTVGNFTSSSGGAFAGRTWNPTTSPSRISVTDLMAQLQGGAVTITTTGTGTEDGDIVISAPIDLNVLPSASSRTLVLQARDDISITAAISDSNPITVQSLSLSLNASLTSTDGNITVGASLVTGAGNITVIGNDFIKSPSTSITTTGGDIDIAASGLVDIGSGTISTSGGNLRIAGDTSGKLGANVLTGGGNLSIDITEAEGISVTGITVDTIGGTGDGAVTLNAFAGGLTIAGGAQFKTGPRGAVSLFSGSSTQDLVIGGSINAGTGGISARANNSVLVNGELTSAGPIIIRSDVDKSGSGNVAINAPITSTGGRIDVEGVMVTTTTSGILTTTGAGASGTISLNGRDGLSIAGSIFAGGILQVNADSDGDGIGVQTVTASLISTGGNITITGTGTISDPIDSNGGNISIPATGSLRINGPVTSDGGLINFIGTGPGVLTLGPNGSLDARGGDGRGNVVFTNGSGSIVTEVGSTIFSGPLGGITIQSDGSPGSIDLVSPVVAGTGGVLIGSAGDFRLGAPITSAGPVVLAANTDGLGGGTLTIDATVTTTSGPVTLRGLDVVINAGISSPDKIVLEHTGTAIINVPITGNVELKSGVTKVTTNSIGNSGGVTLVAPAVLDFVDSTVSISPTYFTQNVGTELRMHLGGATQGHYNRIITGAFQMGGTLTLIPDAGFTLLPGMSFDLFDFATVTGSYATVNLPPVDAIYAWDTTALKTTGVVKLTYLPITSTGGPLVISIPLTGNVIQPIDSNGGLITIPGTGTTITIGNTVVSDGGVIHVTQTGPGNIVLGSTSILDASGGSGNGTVNLTNDNGGIIINTGAILKSGTNGGVNLRANGTPGDINMGGVIETGTQGGSLIGDGNVTITGSINSKGPLFLQADADDSGAGTLTIGGPIISTGDITLRAHDIVITHPITAVSPAKVIIDAEGDVTITGKITGNVELRGGTIKVGNDTIGNDGGIALFSPATLDFINPSDVISPATYTQESGSTLCINIAGPNLGQYNRIDCTGPVEFGGTLKVRLVGSYVPSSGASFDIFDFTVATGAFDDYDMATLPASVIWDTRSLTVDGSLKVIATPPADSKTVIAARNTAVTVPLSAGGLNTLGFAVIGSPAHGALSGTQPNLQYTPTTGYTGEDTFTYRVASLPSSPVATVTIKVLPPLVPLPGGLYAGLIVGPDFAHSGSFAFSFLPSGGISGRLTYGEQSYGFAGTFNSSGQLSASILRANGLSPLTLVIDRTNSGGNTIYIGRILDGNVIAGLEGAAEGLSIDVGGANLGQYDRVNYNGAAVFTGPLQINLVGSYTPAAGAIFDILDFTSVTGDFSSISLPALTFGLMWDTRLLKVDGTLRVISIPPADSKTIVVGKNTSVTLALTAGGMSDVGFTVVAPPTSGVIGGSLPNLTYTPNTDFVGDDSMTYRVSSMPSSPIATISIRVLAGILPSEPNVYTGTISGPDFGHSGSFYFVVNGNTVTGRLIYGDTSYPFTGTFIGNTATITINRAGGLPPLTLILERSTSGGITTITGRLVDNGIIAVLEAGPNELLINIAGPVSGQYNRLNYNGAAVFEGRLRVQLVGGYQPAAGAVFDILDFTSVTGDFTVLDLPALSAGLMWDTRFLKTDGTLRVITIPAADSKVITTAKNVSINFTLTAGGLSTVGFSLASTPSYGTLSGTIPNLTYTPAADFAGEDSFTYRVSDTSASQALATVTISVLPGIASADGTTYTGLITGPDFAHSGSFTFTVAANGSVTGRIIYGDQSLPFTGRFDVNGMLSVVIPRTGGLLPITLIINRSIVGGVTLITGRIIDGSIVAIFEGGGGTPPGTGSGSIVSAGRFTMSVFPNTTETGAAFPQGYGHIRFTVSHTGATLVYGRLPDGAFFTNSTRVQRDGTWPLHIRLYSGKGALQALARFVDGNTVRAVTSKWWKPSLQDWKPITAPSSYPIQLYPAGFLASPSLEGARYLKPVAPTRLLNPALGGNILLTIGGGNLSAPISMNVLLSDRHKVIPLTNTAYGATGAFNTVYGGMTGSFIHPMTGRRVPLLGLINQRVGKVYGSFYGVTETGYWTMEVVNP